MHDRPHAANNLLSILKLILDFAVDIEMLQDNPARPIKGYPKKTAGFHTWTDAEITQYLTCHDPDTRPGKANSTFTLYRSTSLRCGQDGIETKS